MPAFFELPLPLIHDVVRLRFRTGGAKQRHHDGCGTRGIQCGQASSNTLAHPILREELPAVDGAARGIVGGDQADHSRKCALCVARAALSWKLGDEGIDTNLQHAATARRWLLAARRDLILEIGHDLRLFLDPLNQHALSSRRRSRHHQAGIGRHDCGVGPESRVVERAFEIAGAEIHVQRRAGNRWPALQSAENSMPAPVPAGDRRGTWTRPVPPARTQRRMSR